MSKETNGVRGRGAPGAGLDGTDRRILRYLAEDATRSYAELGRLIHLSPPAVHERVKRLRRDGVITGTVATLDGAKIGCPLLAFVHVETEGCGASSPMLALRALADVEEIHTVSGDTGLILKVRTRDTAGLEGLLQRIHAIEGVRATRSQVALNTYLDRGPAPAE